MRMLAFTASTLVLSVLSVNLSAPSVRADQLVGSGKWESVTGGQAIAGTWKATLNRDGEALTGVIDLSGSNVLGSETLVGSLSNGAIVLGSTEGREGAVSFSGTLSDGQVAGEWQFPAVTDEGVWYGTLTSPPPNGDLNPQ